MTQSVAKSIRIDDIPNETYEAIRLQAEAEGLTVSDYLRRQLRLITRPTAADVVERALRRPRENGPSNDDILAAIHESRGD
ncbi:hypothetical protein AB0I81_50060 [Nonomuraea sp. NPDC050404]|uniref:hypothetical protein n=1 Tax=Nonomuraea sp. NPDC050404 TaxID=3155783 RepID=UPI0033F60D1C